MHQQIIEFIDNLKNAFNEGILVKLTLGKPRSKSTELKNIYIRPIQLKNENVLSFTFRFQTRDEVKNYKLDEAVEVIESYLMQPFMKFHLFTIKQDYELSINKKGKGHLRSLEPNFTKAVIEKHDHQKKRYVNQSALYLHRLEITDGEGRVRPSKNDKFKQINKYIEILDALIDQIPDKEKLIIHDMGSGKGYLTFALYDYLQDIKKINCEVIGIELREELVQFCNDLAKESGFKQLCFDQGSILDNSLKETDVLIALHACDTATDDAIYRGLQSKASLIICAPCCHKQVRKSMKPDVEVHPALKHGILMERQAEMLTDTIRSLILELNGYESRIFEFISNEHTGKNLMIAAVKTEKKIDKNKIQYQIDQIKKQFNIDHHHLENLIGMSSS